ncbi:MAG: NAD(P)/FAD-dependent oxidoreductase [Armatimonadetes bacterium]|nr:NAD(P)/FAD-dependent oxidoreductase [Armatimonadota bacterium]MDE2206566.1 NAD(P)/FAD-dependent oxidoreductase [Armatimonadota bacterium]
MEKYDLFVIGGGSAGLKTARTVARAGWRVAVAEERELGGECYWAGCVPTKAMVRAAEVWRLVQHAGEFGVNVAEARADFGAAMRYKDRAVAESGGAPPRDGGLPVLGATLYREHARFESPHIVRVGRDVVSAEHILLAPGTVPAVPAIPGLAEQGYITNREAVALKTLPSRIAVVGGGPIGLELGQVFHRFGAQVTVLEAAGRLLSAEDAEISELVEQYLTNEGMRVITGARASAVRPADGARAVEIQTSSGVDEVRCDAVLVATGRRVDGDALCLAAAGLGLEHGFVPVDEQLRTAQPHILAPGDVHGGALFTHVASYEGAVAAETLLGKPAAPDLSVVPRCTFVDPEVASVGLTEAQAAANGEVRVLRFPFATLDRAILYGDTRGLVKLIVEQRTSRILGGHIVGPHASSLIAEICVCMKAGLPVTAISSVMHAFPTFPEAVEAAALQAP